MNNNFNASAFKGTRCFLNFFFKNKIMCKAGSFASATTTNTNSNLPEVSTSSSPVHVNSSTIKVNFFNNTNEFKITNNQAPTTATNKIGSAELLSMLKKHPQQQHVEPSNILKQFNFFFNFFLGEQLKEENIQNQINGDSNKKNNTVLIFKAAHCLDNF